jgi:hypothetical protein
MKKMAITGDSVKPIVTLPIIFVELVTETEVSGSQSMMEALGISSS